MRFIPDMDFDIMWGNDVTGHITIKDEEIVRAEQKDCEPWKRFIPLMCELTLPLLAGLFEERCWDRERADIDFILDMYKLKSYNPFLLVQKTHGVDYDDKLWFRFKGEEDLTWEDDMDPRRGEYA